jgi:hypothetical protein
MLTNQAFADFRHFIRRRIGKAQYRVGTTWYDAPIVETVIMSDGTVRVKSQIAHGAACTIAEVRLLNTENAVWATKTITVVIETATTNLLQWFDFKVTESEVN